MKRTEFNKADYRRTTVICKSDGPIAYCNALAVDGTCKCANVQIVTAETLLQLLRKKIVIFKYANIQAAALKH